MAEGSHVGTETAERDFVASGGRVSRGDLELRDQGVEIALACAQEERHHLVAGVDQRRTFRILEFLTAKPPLFGSAAISTQLPLGLLSKLFRQVTSGQLAGGMPL